MKLYYMPGACSLAPHIALREVGADFSIEKLNHADKTTESGENFLEINPKGYVPALKLDDGQVLTEVAVVLQYISDHHPAAGLLPQRDTFERYRALEWLNYTATELHKSFSPLFTPGTPDETQQAAVEKLKTRFAPVNDRLADHEFVFGNTFSAIDAYVMVVASWHGFAKVSMDPYPNVAAYVQRLMQRPAVAEAMKAEGLGG